MVVKEKSLLNFYANGFTLAYKSIDIYLITLTLSLSSLLPSFFPSSPLSEVLPILNYLMLIIGFGFYLSVPIFLVQKLQNKPLNFQTMLSITIQNTKKIILSTILLFFILVILLIFSAVIVAILLHPTNEQISQFFQSLGILNKGWNPIFLIGSIIASFFVFTPFMFSLEDKGLLESIRLSITTSFMHLPYLATIILLGMISYSATSFFPITEFWGLFIKYAVSIYVGLIVTTTTLFYFQKKVKLNS